MRNLILITGLTFLTACISTLTLEGRRKTFLTDGAKLMLKVISPFVLPKRMELRSEERCVECIWGSTFSDDRIKLDAEYTDWNEEYAQQFLAKQQEYVKELTEIDGKSAKIQGWRFEMRPKDSVI
jgi:hypothetical protein